jgi:uracil-DNA glycosylase
MSPVARRRRATPQSAAGSGRNGKLPPNLDEPIEIVQPRIILCLGAPAAKSFLGPKFSITKQRGQWNEGPSDPADRDVPPRLYPTIDRR